MRRLFLLSLLCLLALPRTHADDAAEVRAFFDDFTAALNAFDERLIELYAEDARIVNVRNGTERRELSSVEYRELLVSALPLAEKRGDTNSFADVRVTARGDRFRVNAVRTPAIKCVPDESYRIDVTRVDGAWRIVEEYAETVSLSRCPPSEKLAAALERIRAATVPLLPLDLDEDTRLEAIEVSGPVLIYRQHLHTLAADEVNAEELLAALRSMGYEFSCGNPDLRALLDHGGSIRYAYVDRVGDEFGNIDIQQGICP